MGAETLSLAQRMAMKHEYARAASVRVRVLLNVGPFDALKGTRGRRHFMMRMP